MRASIVRLPPSVRDTGHCWNGSQAGTKLHNVLLAFGLARRWPDALSNALTPGWVPTRKRGAPAAPSISSGPAAQDPARQDRLVDDGRDQSALSLPHPMA